MVIRQAHILCGGLGTRLGSLVKDTPKPMLPVAGKPILQHIIEHLKKYGITKVLLVAGYKAEVIEEFFSQVKDWGVDIDIFVEDELLGTGGALTQVKEKLDDNFLVMSGDIFIDFDVGAMLKHHEASGALVTMLSGPSTHPWNSNLLQVDEHGRVVEYVSKGEKELGRNYQNNGIRSIHCVNKKIIEYAPQGKADMEKDIFKQALAAGKKIIIHKQEPGSFIRDMGKLERFQIVEQYLANKAAIMQARAHPKKVRCVFLDRDGTINREKNLLKDPEEVELIPGAAEAIKQLNTAGLKTIVITNQPVIARGLCDEDTHEKIKEKLYSELEKEGAHLDGYYYCPHHPETRWGEGIKELRIGCDCRKPEPGLILQARKEHEIDLATSIMIGDSYRDVLAGKNAGVRTILINKGAGDRSKETHPDAVFPSLKEAAQAIIAGRFNP